jgi:hypothetical protein
LDLAFIGWAIKAKIPTLRTMDGDNATILSLQVVADMWACRRCGTHSDNVSVMVTIAGNLDGFHSSLFRVIL